MSSETEYPYQSLGRRLKAARLKIKKTVAEASGAIELNEAALHSIELGRKRPEEDTLMVLLSYLDIKDEEATKIWQMAGYQEVDDHDIIDLNQQIAMVMPGDLRVVYTDMVHVLVNDFGVVMNFLQGAGPGSQPLAVARIGMSKEHARSVLDLLDKSLKQSDQSRQTKVLNPQANPVKPATKTEAKTDQESDQSKSTD